MKNHEHLASLCTVNQLFNLKHYRRHSKHKSKVETISVQNKPVNGQTLHQAISRFYLKQ